MIRIRYTQWDGTQRVHLDADRIFESFASHLSDTHDVREALDWLVRHGLEIEGVRVVGLEELLERVRAALRSRFAEVDPRSVTDELRRQLDDILDRERETLDSAEAQTPRADEKRAFLDRLPLRLAEAIERLRDYEFEDAGAAHDFQQLLEDLDNIRDLEQFIRRFGDLFHGSRGTDYAEALDLMREIERLKRLEEQLLAGNLDELDLDLVREVLGVEATQHVVTLQQMLEALASAGYLMSREGPVTLSPKGIRKIGQLALRDIYQGLLRDRSGTHATDRRGLIDVRPESASRYRYGDPLHLDIGGTLRNALRRRPVSPLTLAPEDFEVFDTDHATATSTVFLLDMSWSMSWDGRFAAAKKVALAMESLIRSRYPRDFFAVVGFFTRAMELKVADLPEASWNMGDPFTNLQDGLRLAGQILARHGGVNKHIILITDGQPTAYFHAGRLYCEWPLSFGGISLRAARETLKQVERVTRQGIVINTFMLDDSPTLRSFVDRMTRINKGRAFYTRPDRLGEYLLVDYVAKKRRRL
jgi:uncharacterized protein with von Willebrand factor type A (vWA) domain